MKYSTFVPILFIFGNLFSQDCPHYYGITLEKMNVCYEGVDNPVRFYFNKDKKDVISFELSNCEVIKWDENKFVFRFKEAGYNKIIYKVNNKFSSSELIRVKEIPLPIFYLTDLHQKVIEVNQINQINGIFSRIMDLDFNVSAQIKHYNIEIIRKGDVIYSNENNNGAIIDEIKSNLMKVQTNDIIKFYNIEFEYVWNYMESDQRTIKKGMPETLIYMVK